MKIFDLLIKRAATEPEFLEGFSTAVLTGFMALLVVIMLV